MLLVYLLVVSLPTGFVTPVIENNNLMEFLSFIASKNSLILLEILNKNIWRKI